MGGVSYLYAMRVTVAMIAQLVQGDIEGDPHVEILGPAPIEDGTPGTISFLADAKYESFAYSTGSSALLVNRTFVPQEPIQATLIRVDNVRMAVASLLQQFDQSKQGSGTIAEQAFVDPSATIGKQVSIGRFSVVDASAEIGDGSIIHDQVSIGQGVHIGKNCVLFPGVRIYKGCQIGDDCMIHSNAVIGSDGFGFAPKDDGSYDKVPQLGNVILESHVEIGANCVIDRATMGSTVIETGAKLDNLIQIAHNVRIGAHTVIAAQAGIAGSTHIGAHSQIGGQVGIVGHIQIAQGTKIQAQSGVAGAIKEKGQAVYGSPAIPYGNYVRSYAVFKTLPELEKRLRKLEKKGGE